MCKWQDFTIKLDEDFNELSSRQRESLGENVAEAIEELLDGEAKVEFVDFALGSIVMFGRLLSPDSKRDVRRVARYLRIGFVNFQFGSF